MSDADAARRWGEARRWFAIAGEDLRVARLVETQAVVLRQFEAIVERAAG